MKTAFVALLITGLCLTTAAAAEAEGKITFEQKKAEILQRISQRILRIQEEQACVQAAAAHDELKACKAKFQGERKAARMNKEQGSGL